MIPHSPPKKHTSGVCFLNLLGLQREARAAKKHTSDACFLNLIGPSDGTSGLLRNTQVARVS